MRQPKGHTEYGKEGCCPGEWDHTPNITGSYEMDGAIQRCRNRDAQAKLTDHIVRDVAYEKNTAYGHSSID